MDGKGCECFARCEADCICDADWTPAEVVRLRAELDALRHDNARLVQQAADMATELAAANAEHRKQEWLLAERDTLLLDMAELFAWFNRHYPAPSDHPDHPWCIVGMRLAAYADTLTALAAKGDQ